MILDLTKPKIFLLLSFLLIQFLRAQNIIEKLEPVCKDNSVNYNIYANLSQYLENAENIDDKEVYKSVTELKSKPIGTYTGIEIDSSYTNVKRYNKYDELINALRKHEVEAIIVESSVANYTQIITNDISLLPDSLGDVKVGYACQKNSDLFNELNKYITKI